MNQESFEKMDREFLGDLKSVREKKIPEEIRKNFKRSVEERILSGGAPASFGLSFAIVPLLVLALGAGLCWFYLRPTRPVPENMQLRVEAQKIEPLQEVVNPVRPEPVRLTAPEQALKVPELPQVTESNLIAELEALKELGVWTEQDEEEIGISSEQIFVELETMAGEMPAGASSVSLSQNSAQA